MHKLVLASLVTLALAAPAGAQEHTGHAAAAANSPSTQAYEDANARMHENMMMDYTGDADIDFLKGMIPHHKGAVDMAKIVLQYGSDPKIKEMAQAVIDTQEKEIEMMQQWLAEKGQ